MSDGRVGFDPDLGYTADDTAFRKRPALNFGETL
jgi:hypothetical protein